MGRSVVLVFVVLAALGPAAVARSDQVSHPVSSQTTTTLPVPTTSSSVPPLVAPAVPPVAMPIPNLTAVRVGISQAASLLQPVAMAFRTGDSTPYLAEKTGAVRTLEGRVVLDLSDKVASGTEQGLLGLAFSPNGQRLYVDYTDLGGTIRVAEYQFRAGVAEPRSRREVLTIAHPESAIHNGGDLAFGPDGLLWIATGDGGLVGDPHDNAQSLHSLLGKLLRIDPRPSRGRAYSIPATNPFVRTRGARGEIWAYGLRNPWRFSFDAVTGDLWITSVGQDHWESIYFQLGASPGGQNYGWSRVEGSHPYYGTKPAGTVTPIYEYPHQGGACAVIGGYVYRGSKIANLDGAYLFGDLCTGAITAVQQTAGRLSASRRLPVTVPVPTAFGQDSNGELDVLSLTGAVFRLTPG